jgi:hypothetical protein
METTQTNPHTPQATNIKGFMKITGMGEDGARKAVAEKRVKVIRVGRKIIIPLWAIEEFLKLEAA